MAKGGLGSGSDFEVLGFWGSQVLRFSGSEESTAYPFRARMGKFVVSNREGLIYYGRKAY